MKTNKKKLIIHLTINHLLLVSKRMVITQMINQKVFLRIDTNRNTNINGLTRMIIPDLVLVLILIQSHQIDPSTHLRLLIHNLIIGSGIVIIIGATAGVLIVEEGQEAISELFDGRSTEEMKEINATRQTKTTI